MKVVLSTAGKVGAAGTVINLEALKAIAEIHTKPIYGKYLSETEYAFSILCKMEGNDFIADVRALDTPTGKKFLKMMDEGSTEVRRSIGLSIFAPHDDKTPIPS